MSRIWLIVLLLLSGSIALAGESTPSVETLRNQGAARPFWVSAAAAVDAAGDVHWELFEPHVRHRLEFQANVQKRSARSSIAETDTPCSIATVSVTHLSAGRPYGTWRDLSSNAEAVFLGRVAGADVGLEQTTVQTLLTIKVDRVLRPNPQYGGGDVYYVLVPAGSVAIAGARLCNTSLNGFEPRIGDRVLIMAYGAPTDLTGRFLVTREQNLLFERDGKVVVPDSLKNDETLPRPLSFDSLERDFVIRGTDRMPPKEKRP